MKTYLRRLHYSPFSLLICDRRCIFIRREKIRPRILKQRRRERLSSLALAKLESSVVNEHGDLLKADIKIKDPIPDRRVLAERM